MSVEKVFLDLFAGTSPVGKHLASKGYAVIAFDIARGKTYDLSSPTVVRTICGWMRAGLVWAVWCATPCTTTSQARRVKRVAAGMPAALRSAECPRGLPKLSGKVSCSEQWPGLLP